MKDILESIALRQLEIMNALMKLNKEQQDILMAQRVANSKLEWIINALQYLGHHAGGAGQYIIRSGDPSGAGGTVSVHNSSGTVTKTVSK